MFQMISEKKPEQIAADRSILFGICLKEDRIQQETEKVSFD